VFKFSTIVELALLVARLLLGVVFLLAGAAKFGDPKGSSKALSDFGLPPRLAQPSSLLLSAAEIAVAITLVPVSLAWYGACGALALLSVFVLSIGVTLSQGRKPECYCFGQLHSVPVGWSTLARNGILAAPAAWLVFRGRLGVGPSLWGHLASAGASERKAFIVAACVVCFMLFRALRRREHPVSGVFAVGAQPGSESQRAAKDRPGAPLRDRELPWSGSPGRIPPTGNGLPIGTRAPEFELPGMTGEKRSLQALREQRKTILLVFSSPYCEPCQALLPNLSRWVRECNESLNMVIVSRGTAKENLTKLKGVEISRVLLQHDLEVADVYDCVNTPAAVLVGTDGLIQSDLAVGAVAIKELFSSSKLPRVED
jgi:peroxiredoxin/uncharacterized membrane protein YphA (DoxX/SURF4 family)